VGVVEDVRQWGAESEVQAEMYCLPDKLWGEGVFLIMRSTLPVSVLTPMLRREVAALDGELAVTRIRTMDAVVREATRGNRAIAGLVNVFMGVALGLVAVGLYGTLSYHVLQRTREIGVRLALGAVRPNILRLVLLQGTRWVLLGVGLGIAGTLALSSVLDAVVYGMDRWSPSPVLIATFAVGLTSLIACWLPAHKASRLDPLAALRAD
jgi:ABC-type antimicrobial peptide transport system permease subunit